MDFGDNGRAGLSIFDAQLRALPYSLDLVERHPLGSQAFLPLDREAFLVVVAADLDGKPDTPKAFLTAPGQGINLLRNTWHGVLTPLAGNGIFAVIDRIGPGNNLEEFHFAEPYLITADSP
jgi:ureidoglycolate lyase